MTKLGLSLWVENLMSKLIKSNPQNAIDALRGAIQLADQYRKALNDHGINRQSVHSLPCPATRDQWHELTTEQFKELESIIDENVTRSGLKSKLVFLPPIDMYITDNIVMAVLAAIDESIKDVSCNDFQRTLYRNDDLLIDLQRLQVNASIAGFGTKFNQLQARSYAMDADAYATEDIRRSHCKLNWREKFACFCAEYSQKINDRNLDCPIFVALYTNAEISVVGIEEFQMMAKSMKLLNFPHLFHININDIDEGDLFDSYVDPRRKKSKEELRAEIYSKYSKTEKSSPPPQLPEEPMIVFEDKYGRRP